MDYQAREIVILKDDEFVLMLAASGIEKWYGIELNGKEDEPEDDRDFNYNLAALYRKQIVEWSGEKAHITDPHKSMFKILRDAKKCIVIKQEARTGYAGGCYFDGYNVVTVERRPAVEDEIELSMMTFDEWTHELASNEYFPDTVGIPEDETMPDSGFEAVSEFELHENPSGKLIESMKIYEYGLYGIIQLRSGDIIEREFFSTDRAEEVLAGWIGGKA